MSVHIQSTAPEIAAQFDARHVFHKNRHAVLFRERDFFQIFQTLHQTDAAHDEFHSVFFNRFTADVQIRFANGLHYLIERHARRAHFQRVHFDLILPHKPADAADLRDAGNGSKLLANNKILQRTQLAEVVAVSVRRFCLVNVEVIFIDPAEASGVRAEFGLHSRGQLVSQQIQFFQNTLARGNVVHGVLENHRKQRKSKHRIGADCFHAGESLQIHRQRIRNLILHFLRAAARPVGKDDDLIFAQVG